MFIYIFHNIQSMQTHLIECFLKKLGESDEHPKKAFLPILFT